ncbi:MAG TPA: hypothetical protein VFY23_13660 [Candidatus Limnocylindrales bacterium]|nr:hypothetical protein [Candidatus Limnocylindrales bacterium]
MTLATDRRPRVRDDAERSLLLVLVSFVIAVVGTRWFLQLTGYPQVGGGELHVAHMLWGGLLLVLGALLLLVVSAPWVASVGAIATGAGTGLFIDEVGKFITASNDYFYPLAAPLIYGLFLALALVFILVRNRPRLADASAPDRPGRVSHRAFRWLLVVLLFLLGAAWVLTMALYLLLDDSQIRQLIERVANVPGDRVERPTEAAFYFLEIAVLGLAGVALLVASVVLATGRDALGSGAALVGLVVALTAGALLSLYVEQVSAIAGTIYQVALLIAVLRYRRRFVLRAPVTA